MKLYAPEYYRDFTCIADRCRHSCCVGWEIDVDKATMCRYAALTEPYADVIRASIEHHGTPHFRLGDGERCPHLNEQGLCRIILSLGEDCLCDICREHPRFYHTTKHAMEVGLGISCEEACRIVLTSDGYDRMVEIGEEEGEPLALDFDATAHRARIFAMLSDRTVPYDTRLTRIADICGVALSNRTDDDWRRLMGSLEYLNEHNLALFERYSSAHGQAERWSDVLERALAYFLFRHASDAADEDEFGEAVGFSLLCERLLASLVEATEAKSLESVIALARTVSEEIEYSEDNTERLREAVRHQSIKI